MAMIIRFILGSLIGGGLGALIGLLLAPRTGKETRSLIKDEFDTRYQGSKLQQSVKDTQNRVQKGLHDVKEKAQTQVETLQRNSVETADSLKAKAKEVGHALEETGKRYFDSHKPGSGNPPNTPTDVEHE
jgi:gas vesicle protein